MDDVTAAWAELLDRLEADALAMAAASSGSAADIEGATRLGLDVDAVTIGALPAALAERALSVLGTLAQAEQAVAHRVAIVHAHLTGAAVADRAAPPPAFLDQPF